MAELRAAPHRRCARWYPVRSCSLWPAWQRLDPEVARGAHREVDVDNEPLARRWRHTHAIDAHRAVRFVGWHDAVLAPADFELDTRRCRAFLELGHHEV